MLILYAKFLKIQIGKKLIPHWNDIEVAKTN